MSADDEASRRLGIQLREQGTGTCTRLEEAG
jgi:hypothetical protein